MLVALAQQRGVDAAVRPQLVREQAGQQRPEAPPAGHRRLHVGPADRAVGQHLGGRPTLRVGPEEGPAARGAAGRWSRWSRWSRWADGWRTCAGGFPQRPGNLQLTPQEGREGLGLSQELACGQQLPLAAALQRQRRKALAAQPGQQRAALGDVRLRGCARLGVVGGVEGGAVQADVLGRLAQHGPLGDAPALDVVGALQAVQQRQPLPAQGLGRQDGRGRRLAVQHRARIGQQPVEVGGPEGLTAQQGDALVVGHHVVAPRRPHGPALRPHHHAAGVQLQRQPRHLAGRRQQGRRGIAPAAQRVVDGVQHRGVGRGHCGHVISPLATLADSSSEGRPARSG
jgi:hypothetical protein